MFNPIQNPIANFRFKYIVFDLGNVILPFDGQLASRRLSDISGISQEEIQNFLIAGTLEQSFDMGKITPYEFYGQVIKKFSLTLQFNEFAYIWQDIFTLNEGTAEILKKLKGRYRMGLLSNTNKLHFEYAVNKFPILNIVDDFFLSYKLGCLKPDKAIYQKVIDVYQCHPDEIVYTDDIEHYIQTAKNIGFHAIHFKTSEQLKNDLSLIGVI